MRKADCKRKHALRSGSGAAYIGQVGAAHSDGESTLARVVACQLRLTEHAAAEHAQTQARVGSPPIGLLHRRTKVLWARLRTFQKSAQCLAGLC